MTKLFTPPNGKLTLTSSATYESAEISDQSTLDVQGPGTVVTVTGATKIDTASGTGITVENGGALRLLGAYSSPGDLGGYGQISLQGDGATLEVTSGTVDVSELQFLGQRGSLFATNATIVIDGTAASVSVVGFGLTDTFRFDSPAVAVVYTPYDSNYKNFAYVIGVLTVIEANGAYVYIDLSAINGGLSGGQYNPNYTQGNFVIVNGAVTYQTVAPPVKPTITYPPSQSIREGVSIAPFFNTVVSDANAGATDTATVQLAPVTGTLTDPNAATDGSTVGSGVYTVRGTAQAVTAALQSLLFTPNAYTLPQGGQFTTSFNLTVTSTAGTTATASPTVSTFAPLTPSNFAANGNSALLVQNTSGAVVLYTTNGPAVTAATSLGNPGPAWHLLASADLNGDGQADILDQNDSGALVAFLMNGTAIAAGASLGNPGPAWHLRGTGDFNADGDADLLMQNDNGSLVILETNGTNLVGSAALTTLPPGWAVEGVADFNGDGRPDILVQAPDDTLEIFLMNGTAIATSGVVGNPGPNYTVAGTGNYNGDTKADILLHNDNGVNVVWDIADTTLAGSAFVGNSGAGSTVVGGLDLDGDGRSDLVAQNPATSAITASTIAGTPPGTTSVTATAPLGTPGTGWNIVGTNPVTFLDGTGPTLAIAATPGPDQVNLTAYQPGVHTITGLDPAQDTIALSRATFPTYAAVQANEQLYQGGTFINLTPAAAIPTAAIVIPGITPDKLTAADFVLR